uniref:Pre-mRNA cleavage complex 2 protein Pcf11 n=2 Tax=Lygus hesperus TaxID=30085 RepID=A0A0A9XGI4_LYGHE
MSSKDVVEDFCSSLCDLTVNSKPHINMLTMLAEDYIEHAPALVQAVEDQLKHVSGEVKLPVLYLIDSIVKNVGQSYTTLFSKNIANTFTHAFEKVDEKARSQMYKLRQTWVSVFPAAKLFILDTKVNAIDPAWPITAAPTTSSIHLNPKFLGPAAIPPVALPLPLPSTGDASQELLKQKKELLELQKRKVELELMQTKAKLEEQTRRQTTTTPTVSAAAPKEVKKIPPATNIITSKPKLPPTEPPKAKTPSVASLVAPVRIRDPRLRIKESTKDSPSDSPEVSTPPRVVLSPVPSPSNSQSGSTAEPSSKSPKKDKKSKKNKESRSSRKSDESGSTSKSKDKSEKPAKLTRAEEVLRNLEEEQRLSKMQKLGSDTVINKAKQHEQMSHPKSKESKVASPKPAVKIVEVSSSKSEPKIVEAPPRERTPEAPPPPTIPPLVSQKPCSPKSASPKLNETIATSPPRSVPLPPQTDSPSASTSSSKENFSTPEESPKKRKSKHPSKTPSPPQIRKSRDSKSSKRKREKTISPPKDSPKRKTPTRQPTPPQEKPEPVNPSIPEAESLLDSGQDTDLRLLTAKNIELESSSPSKKAKTDMQDLFGTEDVDLRALPPPPPIISRITPPSSPRDSPVHRSQSRSPERQKSWANLKRSNSDIASPDVSKRPYRTPNERRKSDRFINNKDKEGADEELSYDDPAYEQRAKERAEMIMKHAEEQLNNGNITFAQYNGLLKEVVTMNEKRKLEEAIRLDAEECEYDNGKSPSPEPQEPEVEPPNVFNKRRKVLDENQSPRSDLEGSRDDTPPPPPPPEISERDFMPRHDPRLRDDDRRYRGGPPRYEHSRMPPKGPWMGNQGPMPPVRGVMRTRDKFGRWPPMVGPGRPPFDGGRPMRFGQPMMNNFGVGPSSVPPADPAVLDMIAKDPMKTINIDGVPREIRFYGETAIIMMAWDDPRELNFQPGTNRVTFNDRESFLLSFNAPYQDVYVDGMYFKIRLGAPTRELFVDGMHYEGIFNGPPIQVRIGNRIHSVRLQGKIPNVKIGTEQRKDLVAGKVTLIVDANDIFPIYLDAKPQRFDVGGAPYILRFVEALQTVVINGVPFKIEFGSNLPVPMFFRGVKHYLRFSNLPPNVKPGYVSIINMEGGRLPSPPPLMPPPPLLADPTLMSPSNPPDVVVTERLEKVSETLAKSVEPAPRPQPEQPLELLASLMPTVFTPGIGQGYTVEDNSNHPPETVASTSTTSTATTSASDLGSIDVGELLKKLVAVGFVPASDKKEEKKEEVTTEIIPVSFERPDGLKTRQPGLVHLLYSGMQCSSCGVRFPPEQTGKYSQHLDWHFRQNRRERDAMRVAQSRRWNYDVSDWIQYQEIEEKEDRAQSWFEIQEKRNFETEEVTEDEQSVPAGEKGENACCDICQDKFDQFYNEEKEEWHLRRAIEVEGKLYHPLCHKEREEKLQNSVIELTPLDKPVLLVPTEEPELIEIPDDNVSNEPVLCMPIDQEKVETIDLDSEQSNSKDGQEEQKQEDGHESDDDILGIEDVQPQIETVDLIEELDKSDEIRPEEDKKDDEAVGDGEVVNADEVDEEMQVDLSKVKSEKMEVVDLDAQTSQPLVVSSIDGNVELEDAAPVSLPRRIIINIPSAVTKPPREEPREATPPRISPPVEPPILDASEPLPPGEELYPLSVKSRLSEVDLKILQPVSKGSELSALCSIM